MHSLCRLKINTVRVLCWDNFDFSKIGRKIMKIDEIGIFFARNPIFTTPGPQNRTHGDFSKIGRLADDAAWQVGGTMAARPFK